MFWLTFYAFLFSASLAELWSTGATIHFEPTQALPTNMTVSQTVTATWIRESFSETFGFQLIYLDDDGHTAATQTLQPNVVGTPIASATDQNLHGVLTFAPTGTGRAQVIGVKTGTDGTTYTNVVQSNTIAIVAQMNSASDTSQPNTSATQPTDTSSTPPPETSESAISSTMLTSTMTIDWSSTTTEELQSTSTTPASEVTQGSEGKRKNFIAIIVGSVIGGIVFLALLGVLIFFIRRRKKEHRPSEDFRRELMVMKALDIHTSSGAARSQKKSNTEGVGKISDSDPVSSTTPLRGGIFEEEDDDRSSVSGSMYSATSAGARKPSRASGISRTSTADSGGGSRVSIPPLVPLSSNPPMSPAHLRTPSGARTDRQMHIEQKIIELQGRFITARGTDEEKVRTRAELRERIEKVKELRESFWAYGGRVDMPDVLVD